MSVESHRVLIGACGWKHPAWLDDFYDEDLPEDWQLGFYSNEFPVVFVPATDWLDIAGLSGWQDEVTDSFRFILEVPVGVISDASQFEKALDKVRSLENFCLGLVFSVNPVSMVNVKLFKQHLEKALSMTNVCVDSDGHELTTELQTILTDNNISLAWDGISDKHESLGKGALAFTRVDASDIDTAELRKVVEVCLSASTESCVSVMCVDGNPPSLEKMRNADIILNLL